MLLPPLCSQSDYVAYAIEAGFKIFAEPLDISQDVSKTWYAYLFCNALPTSLLCFGLRVIVYRDISVSLVADPSLWALALNQGRDFIAFLRAFQAMRAGYRNGSFRYAVMVFEKRV